MFNKVVLVGNLTRDIELRYTQSGSAIGNTAIAVTRKFTAANGEKREETCFIDIAFFGRQAEIANQYLSKGSKLLVEGRLKFDQWQDQSGQNRNKHSIIVENMEMLGGTSSGGQNGYNAAGGQSHNSGFSGGSNYQNSSSGYNKSYQQPQNSQKAQPQKVQRDEAYDEKVPVIDIDADKYDNDETIPF